MKQDHIVVTILRGESAKEAFAAGADDLINFHYPQKFGYDPKDITIITSPPAEFSTGSDAEIIEEVKRIINL